MIEEMKDLNKLSKEIYEANKAKGFHEEKHSEEHMMCLVCSELMEAVEADRKGRRADWEGVVNLWYIKGMNYDFYFRDFEEHIKDTLEDELADAVIRLLDTAGALDIKIDGGVLNKEIVDIDINKTYNLFTEKVLMISSYIGANCIEKEEHRYEEAIALIISLAMDLDIDLWQHVELKLKYNSLRPYKHGKQY